MFNSFITFLFALCTVLSSTVLAAPALYDLPSRSIRLVRSDPSVYDGYENSFYRGYGADQPFRFGGSQQAW